MTSWWFTLMILSAKCLQSPYMACYRSNYNITLHSSDNGWHYHIILWQHWSQKSEHQIGWEPKTTPFGTTAPLRPSKLLVLIWKQAFLIAFVQLSICMFDIFNYYHQGFGNMDVYVSLLIMRVDTHKKKSDKIEWVTETGSLKCNTISSNRNDVSLCILAKCFIFMFDISVSGELWVG